MIKSSFVVGVAQSAEHRTVDAVVAGSSPVTHPNDRPAHQVDFVSF